MGREQIIFGVDPGSRITGYGAVSVRGNQIRLLSCGIIRTQKNQFSDRLVEIGVGLKKLFEDLKPSAVVVEKIFLGKNADSAFKLGHARGVVLYEVARQQIPLVEYSTREVKKGITGSGAADKEMVRKMVLTLLRSEVRREMVSLEDSKLDTTDALALALYHARNLEVLENLRRGGLEV